MSLDEMVFQAGKAFNNQSVWRESLKIIKEKGGFVQKFVRKAVESGTFDLFDTYGKFW